MSSEKKHYVVYEVTGRNRESLGQCYADRPSRCLRKIAFKNSPMNKERVIDVEEIRPGTAERSVVRYRAKSTLGATSAAKRRFKEEHNIGDPGRETKIQILETTQLSRRGEAMIAAGSAKKKPAKAKAARRRSSSPKQRVAASVPSVGGYSFTLLSAQPNRRSYRATVNDDVVLNWTDALAKLRLDDSSLHSALHKLIKSVGRSFGGDEFAMSALFSPTKPAFELKFVRLTEVPASQPSFSHYQAVEPARLEELPHNVLQVNAVVPGKPKTFVPRPVGNNAHYGNLAKFFSSSTRQSRALLTELANEAIRQLEQSSQVTLQGSTRPIHWVQFQVSQK